MNESDLPWWQSALRMLGVAAGLVALSAILMGFIIAVARFFGDSSHTSQTGPHRIDLTTPAAPEQNARTRIQPPYGPFTTPNSPGRPAAYEGGDRAPRSRTIPEKTEAPEPAVGIPDEKYRETIESGKKVYLPNPKGECDLSGGSAAKSIDALDKCFAQRAAR